MKIYPIELSKLYLDYREEYIQAFYEALEKGVFIGGKEVDDFETSVAEYLGARYAIGCGNGTQAIELALMANDIGKGSEVITVANTYYATARAIVNVGAEPVFCDVNEYGLIDLDKIENLITERTKAILPVHLYGAPADLDNINQICKKHGIVLIEDSSHAFGSRYKGKKIGADSYCACFSLYPTKNLGAMGDAGIVVTNSEKIAERIRSIRYYTSDPERLYFSELSLHSRIDTLQCIILQVSLRHIDEWNQKRRKNADRLISRIKDKIPYIESVGWDGVVPYVFPVFTDEQERLVKDLYNLGIIAQVHYRPELHKIKHLTERTYNLPMTERLNRSVVSVPVSPTVNQKEIDYIADCLLSL